MEIRTRALNVPARTKACLSPARGTDTLDTAVPFGREAAYFFRRAAVAAVVFVPGLASSQASTVAMSQTGVPP